MTKTINIKKGIVFSMITAVISGFSIFLNANYVNKVVKDPFVSTSARNIVVAIFLSSLLLGLWKLIDLKRLSLKQWGILVVIGLIGGSIPFLLFFKGLSVSQTAGLNGAFIHKTLFLWMAILGVVFLKEKLSLWQAGGLVVLLAGTYLAGGPKNLFIGSGEKLVILAVVLWAIEFIVAKKILKDLPSLVVAWGRMFFGSLFLIGFLAYTDRITTVFSLNPTQWSWIIGTGILLFGYVATWYTGLKYAPANIVASILTLGFPITVILNNIFISHKWDTKQLVGIIIICLAVIIISQIRFFHKELKLKYATS